MNNANIYLQFTGKEFLGAAFVSLLEEYNISFQAATGYNKLAIGERMNYTLQVMIYRFLGNNETERYIDVLPDLIKSYNSRPHRTLRGLTPDFADKPENEILIRGIIRERLANIPRSSRDDRNLLKKGQIVRIKKLTPRISAEGRGYMPKYRRAYYVIDRVDLRMPRPMYHLYDMDSEEKVLGGFYLNELSVIGSNNVWKVDKILKTRGKAPNREYFVKWSNFSDKHNSWISERDITESY